MNIVYIEKAKNIDEILSKWQRRLPLSMKKRLAKSKVYFEKQGENVECKVFFYSGIKDKVLENIGQNLKNTIVTNEYKNVVISNELKKNSIIMDKLQSLNILNGRWLFNYLISDVINYILLKKNKEIEKSEISILVNKTTDTAIQNILNIAKNAKILNIVTQNLAVFKQIEEKLYIEQGIMIRVTNNKKRSLLKSDVIINLDFTEEELAKYYLPSRGIIVNVNNKIKIKKRSFSGININGYNISIPDEYKREGFEDNEMYESLLFRKTGFQNVINRIKGDKIKIISLIGNKGIINEKEYTALQ